ncbi:MULTISPECIES: efflux RND transporter periplasmic adaptor subunit [unclassified Pseudomonas]|uniref:efflux RND transporter periplasmic adaptor subunit n=1 Tax=unclassified Pseudomonas TaxID=196821 RepID=UPI0025DE0E76|nr:MULTISPECIES: HlyD family efflux transporter periplasmic adaptor subunit [unclassified Pseudomonas]
MTEHSSIGRLAIGLGTAVAIVATLAAIGMFNASEAVDQGHWLAMQPQVLERQLGLVGRIEAANKQTLSAPFEGRVEQLTVSEGQQVERSSKLLVLDTTQLDIQIRQASAELLKARRTARDMQDWGTSDEVARARRAVTNAELNLNDSQARLGDSRRLLARGIVARMEVEAQEQQVKLQQLDLAAAKAELRAACSRGDHENRQIADMELANARARHDSLLSQRAQRELHAPFTGVVLRPQKTDGPASAPVIQTGRHVPQGFPLFELVSLEQINAVTRIQEADLHQIHEGMPVQVTGDGFEGLTLQGHVRSIGAQSLAAQNPGGGYYEVIVSIDRLTAEQQPRVRLGMSARLTLTTYRNGSGLAVPAEALNQDADGVYVIYRPTPDEPAQRVPVTLGMAVPQGVEVTGLQPGYVRTTAP